MRSSLAILILAIATRLSAADPLPLPTVLMRSTFKIQGPAAVKGRRNLGTGFVMAQPDPSNPSQSHFVLVTANHVLEHIVGAKATLLLRTASGGEFQKLMYPITIRANAEPLWVRHPVADVAAMRVALPKQADLKLVSTNLLCTDQMLEQHQIGPGEELIVLGFPHGAEANAAGFPILRSGRIASYPLTPTSKNTTFLLDFLVFPGNSGGPVFLYAPNRTYDEQKRPVTVQFVMGLVSRAVNHTEHIKAPEGETTEKESLALGVIVHASLIRETLERLPPPKQQPATEPLPVPRSAPAGSKG